MPAVQLKECRTGTDVIENYKAVRARMQSLKPPPPKVIPIVDQTPESEPIIVVPAFQPVREIPPYPPIREIARYVAKRYRVTFRDILADRRSAGFVLPRHITFHLCCLLTPHSLPAIGRQLGGRDHTTIIHGNRRIKRMRGEDSEFDAKLTAMAAEIMEGRS